MVQDHPQIDRLVPLPYLFLPKVLEVLFSVMKIFLIVPFL